MRMTKITLIEKTYVNRIQYVGKIERYDAAYFNRFRLPVENIKIHLAVNVLIYISNRI